MSDTSRSYNDADAALEKKSVDDGSSEHGVVASDALHHGRSGAATAKLWTKLDLLVLPVVTMMYFLSSLDRSNIGNARIAGLQKELHMSDYQYSLALTVTLIPYTIIEIPSNYLMMLVGPRILLPTMVVLWGIICTLQGVVTSYSGLVACRFFLGLVEGGLLPGITFYLACFYPRRLLQLRVSVMFSATSIASAFSGLLAAAIIHMEGVGGRHGWAWVFILEGLFTVLFGIVSFFLLPDTPEQALLLSAEDKKLIVQALHDDGLHSDDEKKTRTWAHFGKTFIQPHVVLLGVAGFFSGATLSGLAYFLPSIVASLGYAGSKAQLMSVPPFAVAAVLSIITAIFADRYAQRGLTLVFFAILATIGFGIFLGSYVKDVRYGSLFLAVPGTYCIGPPLGTWMANNSAPLIRRGASLALLTTMTNLGSILSTWLLGSLSPPPRYTSATITLLVFQIGILLCSVVNMGWLATENKRKERTKSSTVERESEGSMPNESVWFRYVM
ncbi:MFS general substrate transporter [Lentinus tigrinus ALCF2SS1-7]|uniref:MFS general substrate transporter n=1 Tax=Lentinus tigrinus ALCF2SS1-6 TaxID=1328759 RepID=A0A5C2RQH4_9APHY|nr:MFS general substrate transporter [Lentinus tigrinus ALCF2SS1-6]RPD75372.1 MFS general substrate transporter [Lentinus tigrinus ALCF2SS1-7]